MASARIRSVFGLSFTPSSITQSYPVARKIFIFFFLPSVILNTIFLPMKKPKTVQPIVRRSITLPLDLEQFALSEANQGHCGNLSAYLRELLHTARRKSSTPAPKSTSHVSA